MKCGNCGNTLTCGCQKRTASNGTQVCTACLQSYEIKLNAAKAKSASAPEVARIHQETKPVVTGVSVVLG